MRQGLVRSGCRGVQRHHGTVHIICEAHQRTLPAHSSLHENPFDALGDASCTLQRWPTCCCRGSAG